MNTCKTCKHYKFIYSDNHKECDNGNLTEHIYADADDDSGLYVGFTPPPTFGCNLWESNNGDKQ